MRASIFMSLLTVACTDKDEVGDDTGDTGDTFEMDETDEGECSVDVVAFDYSDQTSWVESDPDCGGSYQSPIDLDFETFTEGEAPILDFGYTTTPLHVVNNGHSVEYEVDGAVNTLNIDGVDYALVQFHFHSPSEHTVNGEPADMEMHLVHESGDALAVVSIVIFEGAEQPWIAAASWDALPAVAGECIEDEAVTLDMDDLISTQLIGKMPNVLHYTGSLTTPPCSEEVEWFILGQYLELSAEQIAMFSDIYSGNSRDVHDLGDRDLILDEHYGK
ncbi:MAG: carbonic anhydrase [Myxococcota bacterium]|jgi:carbonic anhydrase